MNKLITFLTLVFVTITTAMAQNTSWYTANPDAEIFYISTESDLKGLSELVTRNPNPVNFNGKTIILNDDINLVDTHTPIGNQTRSFRGVFDGNEKTISTLTVLSGYNCGLFGYVADGGQIKNLTLNVSKITTSYNYLLHKAGGLSAHYASTKAIENCIVNITDSIYAATPAYDYETHSYSGGLVGFISAATTIINCYTTGKVSSYSAPNNSDSYSSDSYSGGLVGGMGEDIAIKIINSHTKGDIFSNSEPSAVGSSYSGGLIGFGGNQIEIYNSYATGSISAHSPSGAASYSGGLVGKTGSINIKYSYTNGDISATSIKGHYAGSCYSGGLIGYGTTITIENSYSDGDINAHGDDGANAGGIIGRDGFATIKNSYSTGNVFAHGTSYFSLSGGLIGNPVGNTDLINCYASGIITATGWNANYGGLFGNWNGGTTVSTYYNSDATNKPSGISYPIGYKAKTSIELTQESTFEGWNFDEIWGIDSEINDGYPYLPVPCDHEYGELKIIENATCETDGYKAEVCSICGKKRNKVVIPKLGHLLDDLDNWVITKQPTCTEAGDRERVRTCTRIGCDHSETETDIASSELSALGHDWGEWAVIIPATCMTIGTEERVCRNNSDHKETQEIPVNPTAHDYGDWILKTPATCTDKAVEERVCSHNPEHKETREFGEVLGHDWGDWTVIIPVTCMSTGTEERVCRNNPDHKETRGIDIDADAHSWGKWSEWEVTTLATCTETGIETRTRVCQYNNEHVDVETREIDIDADVHDWGEWVKTADATCTTKEQQERTCKHNSEHKETREVGEVLEHDFSELGEEIVPATCEVRAIHKAKCSICGEEHDELVLDGDFASNCDGVSIKTDDTQNGKYGIKIMQNPVKDKAEIKILLPNDDKTISAKIVIYDMTGNIVFSSGTANHSCMWDLKNNAGRFVANGTYLIVAEVKTVSGNSFVYSAKLGVKR